MVWGSFGVDFGGVCGAGSLDVWEFEPCDVLYQSSFRLHQARANQITFKAI